MANTKPPKPINLPKVGVNQNCPWSQGYRVLTPNAGVVLNIGDQFLLDCVSSCTGAPASIVSGPNDDGTYVAFVPGHDLK